MELIWLLFFAIALIYSSAGFGGGSSYIAIMLLLGVAIPEVRFTALFCNIIVVLGATINFTKAGLYNWKKVLSLVILSVPLAFMGGMISPEGGIYKIIAGSALVTAAILMLIKSNTKPNTQKTFSPIALSGIGGGIGLLSGFMGMGGGVFLAPTLHLIKWDNTKAISAATSLFILVNSIAGISGLLISKPSINYNHLFVLGACVFVGGQIGNHLNIKILNPKVIKLITAILVGIVGARVLILQTF